MSSDSKLLGSQYLSFAVLIKTWLNSNTICEHMPGVPHLSLEGISPVVMENEPKYAWGGLPIMGRRMGRARNQLSQLQSKHRQILIRLRNIWWEFPISIWRKSDQWLLRTTRAKCQKWDVYFLNNFLIPSPIHVKLSQIIVHICFQLSHHSHC